MADIKSKVFNMTNNLAKSGGDFVRNTKLNIELANQEEHLKSIYTEIGKKVHEIYSFGGSLGVAFDDLYKDVVVCEGQIRELKKRIDVVKGVSSCEKCGKNVERKAEFCPSCGARMYAASEFSAPATVTEDRLPTPATSIEDRLSASELPILEHNDAPVTKKCPSCGEDNANGTRFCLGCGRVIGS